MKIYQCQESGSLYYIDPEYGELFQIPMLAGSGIEEGGPIVWDCIDEDSVELCQKILETLLEG